MAIQSLAAILQQTGISFPNPVPGLVNGAAGAIPHGAELLTVHYPATAETVTQVVEDDASAVDHAVQAARQAFDSGPWPRMSTPQRQAILRKAASLIREHQQELAILETLCAGLPVSHLTGRQIPRAAENFEFFSDYLSNMAGETFEQESDYLTLVTREPAGVAALVAPWNAPLALASMQIASCIAFGNTCVSKPSEFTPLAVHRMIGLLHEAGLPPGVVNLVNGRGAVTGHALVSHPGVDRIAFTGGSATARRIMTDAAANLTPVHMELGGKSANIVFNDADLERAVDGSLVNIFSNNGQLCAATVHPRRHHLDQHPFVARSAGAFWRLQAIRYWPRRAAPMCRILYRRKGQHCAARVETDPENGSRMMQLLSEEGAVHLQIGKSYLNRAGLQPESYALVRAIKQAVDPDNRINPGALGL